MAGLAFLKRFFGGAEPPSPAASLYGEISAIARTPALYEAGGVPDTFDGRFDMIVLHVALVLRRLGGEGAEAKELSQGVFDSAFTDFDEALRDIGVGDMSIGKKIKQMAQAFYGRMQTYDQAFGAEGPEALNTALNEALQRNVFRGRPVEAEHVAYLADHARAFGARLAEVPTARLLEGRLFDV